MRWLVAIVAWLAFAPAAYAQGKTVQGLDVGATSGRWDPPEVAVKVGEAVTWRWDGTISPRNVKSAVWPADQGDVSGFIHTFTVPGDYPFRCQFHAAMTGKVTVTDASGSPPPPPPPPPLSEQYWANDQQAPTVFERPDEIRPRLGGVRAAAVRNGARVRFRLSERARVTVRLKLAGLTVKSARRSFRAGRRSLVVRDRRLDGRYRIEVVARDLAGNRSRVRRASVRVG